MNPTILAGVVKRFYPSFNMSNFDNRLKLQKLIYILQSGGLNLGYNFRLYLHGPYCTLLAREGFDMPSFDTCKIAYFEEKGYEKKLKNIMKFLNEYHEDANKMEIIASLLFFHKILPEYPNSKIVDLVINKDQKFNKQEKLIEELLNKLITEELFLW